MRRPLLILAAMLIAGVAVFFVGQRLAAHWCAQHLPRPTDDLTWLRLEFQLNDAELARVRQLHDGYLPKCREFCERIDARGSYKPDQKFSTWLFTIAANLARNQLRWRSRHPNVSLDAESETTEQTLGDTLPSATSNPHQATVATERAEAVRAAVQTLPDDMREAIVLCEWEDMAVAEAAAVLQSTPKAVESRLYRARNLLRERLRKWL